jgi:hypothetical protein
MKEYTRLIATTFHGCRLDNFHSAALWLTQEMMDYARQINPIFISMQNFLQAIWKQIFILFIKLGLIL